MQSCIYTSFCVVPSNLHTEWQENHNKVQLLSAIYIYMNSSVIVPIIWFYITVVAVITSFYIVVSCVFISLFFWGLVSYVSHCNHNMAPPPLSDGGTASGYGGWAWIYWISRHRQPTRDGPPAWRLGEALTTQFKIFWIILQDLKFWQVTGARECGNDSSHSINCGEFLNSWGPISFSRRNLLLGVQWSVT